EDLSLVEAFAHLIRHPFRTWPMLSHTLNRPVSTITKDSTAEFLVDEKRKRTAALAPSVDWLALAPLGLMCFSFLIALAGSLFFSVSRGPATDSSLAIGGALLVLGAIGMGVV